MLLQVRMAGIVIAGDSSLFKRSIHSFDLPVCLGGDLGQAVFNAVLNTDTVKWCHKGHRIFFAIHKLNTVVC